MSARRRFHETLAFGRPDRVPLWEEGLRDDVLARWHTEGLPAGQDLADIFTYDQREQIEVNLRWTIRQRLRGWNVRNEYA